MKKIWIYGLFVALTLNSCKENGGKEEQVSKEEVAEVYGEDFSGSKVLSAAEMREQYQAMEKEDTLQVTFKTHVNAVCKNKGCWMELDIPEEKDVMVKFKDYAFFVPKDIDNKEVIVNGKAYVTEVSVDEQRHYAEDKGASPEEVAAITEPKRTWSFMAEGVKIKE